MNKSGPGSPDPLMFALLAAAHALEVEVENALATAGLSLAKLGVLTLLVEAGEPVSLSDLAAHQRCVRSNMTQLVDRLEAEGLVRRVDDPRDRRGVLAALTPLGVDRQAEGKRQVEQLQSRFATRLPQSDRAALKRALAALR